TLADATQIDPATAVSYTIVVQAFDGTDTSTQTFTIAALFDTPANPVDVDNQNNSIPEGAPQGSRVGVTVFALDGQDEDVFYVQTDAAGDPLVGDHPFAINPQTGVVTVKTSSLLDFSQATQHTIFVRAIDEVGNATPIVPFVINVTDVPDNAPPIASILPTRVNVVEGTGTSGQNFIEFQVKLNKPSALPVTVNFTTRRGNEPTFVLPEGIALDTPFATDQAIGRDYYRSTGSVTIAAGATEPAEPVRVQIETDNRVEADEFFFVQLESAVNATLVPLQSVAIAQILDDDSVPQLIISDAQTLEGDGNTNQLRFRVELVGNILLDGGLPVVTSVDFSTGNANIDSAIADADYSTTSGTLTFTNSTRVQFVEVDILGDLDDESDETVSLRFTNALNLGLPRPDAVGTILNDDSANVVLQITPGETAVREDKFDMLGNLVEQRIPLVVTLVGKPLSGGVTVTYTIQDGTATIADGDYSIPGGTFTGTIEFTSAEIAAGMVTETIEVIVVADTTVEATEAFSVELSLPSNASIDPDFATSTIVIRNDDEAILREDGDDLTELLTEIFDDPGGNNGAKDPAVVAMLVAQARQFIADQGLTEYILIVIDPVDFVLTDPQSRSSGFTENTGVVNQIPGTYYSGNGSVEVLVVPLPPDGNYNVQLSGVGGDGVYNGSATVVKGGTTTTTAVSGSLAEGSTSSVALQVGNSNSNSNSPITVGLGLAAAKAGNNATLEVAGGFGQLEFNNLVAQLFQNLPFELLDDLDATRTMTDEEIQERAEKLLKKLDKNNDNVITADEVEEEDWKTLRQSDKDADGQITLEELQTQIRANATSGPKTPAPTENGQRSSEQNQPNKPQGNSEGAKAKPTTFERNRSTPAASPNKTDKSSQPPAQPNAGKGQGKSAQSSRPAHDESQAANSSRSWWHVFLPWSEKNSTKPRDTRNV
ncbi:MAG: hypothetical protein IAG10_30580, partial [Planctomycetaceae bacterium]|nr:hypothetical protein [Planctomycetaceae bacterium]